MQALGLEALRIPVVEGVFLRIEDEQKRVTSRPSDFILSLSGGPLAIPTQRSMEAPGPRDRPPFYFDASAPERGLNALRLFELRDYSWELEYTGPDRPAVTVTSSLENSSSSDLWRAKEQHGRFRFVNFLGAAWIEIQVPGLPPKRITFEVASPKLDYELEYRNMVEAIGNECQQLLLEWGSPTTVNIQSNPEKRAQTLLEQFLFLRHVLGPDRLDLYLEILQHRPHTSLARERDWKPAGSANPALFVRNPLLYGRDWHREGGQVHPGQVLEERKFDSLDTPPNRFVKFALQTFRNLCNEVLNFQNKKGERLWKSGDSVWLEATSLRDSLDSFLNLPLFEEVGELRRIPFESTTLQRREGYREILLAWLMLDAAAQIDWPGRENAYDGTVRDVATLYEYWLYFVLVRGFENELKMVPDRNVVNQEEKALPFCCQASDGRLLINLKQGNPSFSRFRWKKNGQELLIHFFYNRSFGKKDVGEPGSYSKTFRPDYTLVIIPVEFDSGDWASAEKKAEAAGKISYLHFDAKYRGENLPGLFGMAETEEDEPEDRQSRASGTVKNPDLYKMHTYNEAIRRTVGSYVLYPGADVKSGKSAFQRYHEIVPGIGAFAMRPQKEGLAPDGLPGLMGFIEELLSHQLDRFTQSYRITSTTESVIRDQPVSYLRKDSVKEILSLPSATVVLGYMKQSDVEKFKTGNQGIGPFFYCRATGDDGEPLQLDISAAQGAVFIGWSGSHVGPYKTVEWMAKISSCRLVGREVLKAETGVEPSSDSVHYLLFKLADVAAFPVRDISTLVSTVNHSGKGGKFRTFQASLRDVMNYAPVER